MSAKRPDNDNFCPDDNVSRGQMATFMQRFAQFLGAEDGTVSEADHATTADSATTADKAANSNKLGGKSRYEYQPALFAFEGNQDFGVSANETTDIATGIVETSAAGLCVIGLSPQTDILVRASGYVTGIGAAEVATFRLAHEGTAITGTTRQLRPKAHSRSNGCMKVPEEPRRSRYKCGSCMATSSASSMLISRSRCCRTPVARV